MADNIVDRDEAEILVKSAVDDYLDIETLQQILDLIYGDEFIVVEDNQLTDDDDDEMDDNY